MNAPPSLRTWAQLALSCARSRFQLVFRFCCLTLCCRSDSISSVYDAVDAGCYDVSLDVLLALQTGINNELSTLANIIINQLSGKNVRIANAIVTEFHKNVVEAMA